MLYRRCLISLNPARSFTFAERQPFRWVPLLTGRTTTGVRFATAVLGRSDVRQPHLGEVAFEAGALSRTLNARGRFAFQFRLQATSACRLANSSSIKRSIAVV